MLQILDSIPHGVRAPAGFIHVSPVQLAAGWHARLASDMFEPIPRRRSLVTTRLVVIGSPSVFWIAQSWITLFWIVLPSFTNAAVVTDPTSAWTPVQYASPAQSDYQNDQQTGNSRSSSDIVGDANNPAFFMQFDDGGTAGNPTDGTLMFRVRLGAPGGNRTAFFDRNLFVGIDGDGNGSLDLYLGVHNQGSSDELAIYSPGTDLNVSPNTTSISGPIATYAQTSANYHYAAVDTSDTDIDGDSETDHHLSFAFSFQDVVDWMFSESSLVIDESTPLSYVMATATQDNSFNQDINGLPKNFDASATWTSLGALSQPFAPIGGSVSSVPEPDSTVALGLLIMICTMTCRRSRSRRRWLVFFE